MTKPSLELEAFYPHSLREFKEAALFQGKVKQSDRDNQDDASFQQTIYYIGGSAVRTVSTKAEKATHCEVSKKC